MEQTSLLAKAVKITVKMATLVVIGLACPNVAAREGSDQDRGKDIQPKPPASSLVPQAPKPQAPPPSRLKSEPPSRPSLVLSARPSPGYQGLWFESWIRFDSAKFKVDDEGRLWARSIHFEATKDDKQQDEELVPPASPVRPRFPTLKIENGEIRSLYQDGTVAARWKSVLRGQAGPGTPTNFVFFTQAAAYRFEQGSPPQHLLSVAGPVEWVVAPTWSTNSCPTIWIRQTTRFPLFDTLSMVDLCGPLQSKAINTDVRAELAKIPRPVFPLRLHSGWLNDDTFIFSSGAQSYTTVKATPGEFLVDTVERDEFLVQMQVWEDVSFVEWSKSGFHRVDPKTAKETPLFSPVLSRKLNEVAFLNDGDYLALGMSGFDWSCRAGNAAEQKRPYAVVLDLKTARFYFRDAVVADEDERKYGDFRPSADGSGLEVLEPGRLTKVWKPWLGDTLHTAPIEAGWYCSPDKALLHIEGKEIKVSSFNYETVARFEADDNDAIAAQAEFSKQRIISVATSRDNQCIGVLDEKGNLGVFDSLLSKPPKRLPTLIPAPKHAQIALDDSCQLLAIAQDDLVQLVDISSGESVFLHLLQLDDRKELAVRHSKGWVDLGPLGQAATFVTGGSVAPKSELAPIQYPHLLESFVKQARGRATP